MGTQHVSRRRFPTVIVTLLGLALLLATPAAVAQQHTATRLGNPATRFADPLETPEELRQTLLSEALREDVLTILRLSGYQGSWEDFRRAVAGATITETEIPTGTRLAAMSSRKNGKAVLLHDVLWAGQKPFAAYEFTFSSQGRRYRVVTPKPCANFWVEDQGREAPPALPGLQVSDAAPAETGACDPFGIKITVLNSGNTTLTQVQAVVTLPPGLQTVGQRSTLTLNAGTLPPGNGMAFKFDVRAAAPGKYESQVRATSAEGVTAHASATTVVRGPSLALECRAPAEVFLRRPADVCFTIRNNGDGPESLVTLTVPIPAGAMFVSGTGGPTAANGRVTWEIPNIAPGTSRDVCAVFTAGEPGTLTFAASAGGACAPPVNCECTTRVAGIPAILLEVVDLEDPIEVGKDVTYVIEVTNQGSASLTNLKVVCNLEETQEYVSTTGPTPAAEENRIITFDPLPELKAKQKAVWHVVVKALTAGDIRFTAALTCDHFTHTIQETESTCQY